MKYYVVNGEGKVVNTNSKFDDAASLAIALEARVIPAQNYKQFQTEYLKEFPRGESRPFIIQGTSEKR